MAPKRKSTPSQSPLRFGASSSSDSIPLHVRFCDEKACQDFSENFSRRAIHLECQVILSDFSNTDLPTVIHNQGWESLCDSQLSLRDHTGVLLQYARNLIIPYIVFSLLFEVYILLSHRSLSPMCYMSRGYRTLITSAVVVCKLYPKKNSCLSSMRHLHLGVIVKTPLAQALQKVQGS